MKGKIIFLISLTLFLITALSLNAGAETLHVGYFVLKPHCMEGDQGVAIEYFKLIVKKMGISDVQFRGIPLKRALIELEREQIDVILLLAKNAERAEKFVYPHEPVIKTKPVIAVRTSHPLTEVKSVEDLLPYKFTNVAKGYRSPMMKDARLQLDPMHGDDTLSRGIFKVLNGRVDGYYIPDLYSMRFVITTGNHDSQIRIITLPDPELGLYSVFSKKRAEKYLKSYETALKEIQKEQPYDDFFEKIVKNYK